MCIEFVIKYKSNEKKRLDAIWHPWWNWFTICCITIVNISILPNCIRLLRKRIECCRRLSVEDNLSSGTDVRTPILPVVDCWLAGRWGGTFSTWLRLPVPDRISCETGSGILLPAALHYERNWLCPPQADATCRQVGSLNVLLTSVKFSGSHVKQDTLTRMPDYTVF